MISFIEDRACVRLDIGLSKTDGEGNLLPLKDVW
jgi:hypothetical protein